MSTLTQKIFVNIKEYLEAGGTFDEKEGVYFYDRGVYRYVGALTDNNSLYATELNLVNISDGRIVYSTLHKEKAYFLVTANAVIS